MNSIVDIQLPGETSKMRIGLCRGIFSTLGIFLLANLCYGQSSGQAQGGNAVDDDLDAVMHLPFDGNLVAVTGSLDVAIPGQPEFLAGLASQALSFRSKSGAALLSCPVDQWKHDSRHEFCRMQGGFVPDPVYQL